MKVPKETLEERFEFEMIEMKQELPARQETTADDDHDSRADTDTQLTDKAK
ncbi:hypothetical protein [Corallincola spongiicola]|uniref:hypothetical protein n=1 Tax=Corallincola spongiicola TaxID=2520508 RepID=UPI0013EE5C1F|nr:hypothetical protein [Corallincola spongiicola]